MNIRLKNLSIKTQIMIPMVLSIVILLIGCLYSGSSLKNAFGEVSNSTATLIKQKDSMTHISDNAYAMRITGIYSLFKHEEMKVSKSVLRKHLDDSLSMLNWLMESEELSQEASNLRESMTAYVNFYINKMHPLLEEKHGKAASIRFSKDYDSAAIEYRNAGNKMISDIETLSEKLDQVAMAKINENEALHGNVILNSQIGMGAILLLAMTVSWFMTGATIAPIKSLQAAMKEVAKGNMRVEITSDGKNEVAMLSKDIDSTIKQLGSTISSLIQVSDNVASASTELAAVMTQSTVNSDLEKNEVEQVASAVNQLESTANEVSQSAVHAETASTTAQELTDESLKLFAESNKENERMSLQITDAASAVSSLEEQSVRIGSIIEVIQNISEQTNLLALNAAIEAARAGESGRGFAVVADEVRMLAARTQESTKDIQDLIGELQNKSSEANTTMLSSLEIIENNQALAAQVSSSMTEIAGTISQLSDINRQVATASEEQNHVTADINKNLSNIYDLVSQNVTGITQSAATSKELSDLAENQREQLSYFTV